MGSEIRGHFIIFQQRLTDSFIQEWKSRIMESSRAKLYSLFFKICSSAVPRNRVKKSRNAITRLRDLTDWKLKLGDALNQIEYLLMTENVDIITTFRMTNIIFYCNVTYIKTLKTSY